MKQVTREPMRRKNDRRSRRVNRFDWGGHPAAPVAPIYPLTGKSGVLVFTCS